MTEVTYKCTKKAILNSFLSLEGVLPKIDEEKVKKMRLIEIKKLIKDLNKEYKELIKDLNKEYKELLR